MANLPTTGSSRLCDLCRGINIESLRQVYPHVGNIVELRSSSRTCPLCLIFYNGLDDESKLRGMDEDILQATRENRPLPHCPAEIQLADNLRPETVLCFQLWGAHQYSAIVTVPGDPACGDIHPCRLETIAEMPSSDSAESMRQAALWIQDCVSNHQCSAAALLPHIATPADPTFAPSNQAPSRLVQVAPFSSLTDDVRLIDVAAGAWPQYATMSHCWGPKGLDKPSKSTLSNLQSYKACIPYTQLCKNFQDAIQICRKLGFKHVWIDALCIVQDSNDDWNVESSKMGSIYSRSIVTIAASASGDSSGGCFRTFPSKTPEEKGWVRLESTLSDGSHSTLFIGRQREGYLTISMPRILQGPLATRAWALQERILSPRTLHYTDDMLIWECRRAYQAGDNLRRWNALNSTLAYMAIDAIDSSGRNYLYLRRWFTNIVPLYTSCSVTKSSDELPALAGVARLFANKMKSTYIAGHWLDDIGIGLSWMCSGPGVGLPSVNEAPSWSWLSAPGPVRFDPKWVHWTTRMVVEDHGLDLVGIDPFGTMNNVWVRVRAPAITAVPKATGSNGVEWRTTTGEVIGPVDVDAWTYPFPLSCDFACFLLPAEQVLAGEIRYALVLRAVAGKPDRFARVGMWSIASVDWDRIYADKFSAQPERSFTLV